MLIQNEFCNGGNLSARVAANCKLGHAFSEDELRRLVRHVSMVHVTEHMHCDMHDILHVHVHGLATCTCTCTCI